jgi:DNA-binding XRE family transcriptional regulator
VTDIPTVGIMNDEQRFQRKTPFLEVERLFPWGQFIEQNFSTVKFPLGNTRRFRNAAGPQIRKFRNQKELTQDQLAAKIQLCGLDLDRTALAKIEAQIRSVFDFELAIIAKALGVPMSDLVPVERRLREILPALMSGKR